MVDFWLDKIHYRVPSLRQLQDIIPVRKVAEVIGQRLERTRCLQILTGSGQAFYMLTPFIAADNRVSSKLTQERMGWRPTQPSLMSDLEKIEA